VEFLELRVHGVHGTSPGSMLGVGDGDVEQVAGDDLTGVYRATGPLPLRDLAGTEVAVEAYSWGALTSGVRGVLGWVKRTLWLLLLPFALVNLACWARTEAGHDSHRGRLGARAVRVAGLVLTVFFVLTPCVVFIDLGAWQCFRYGVPSCERVPGWLDFLGGWSPAQRVGLASLAPVAGVLLLHVLSRTSLQRYEAITAAAPSTTTALVLRHPHLWNGTQRTERLQRAHVAAGLATVVLFVSLHLQRARRPDTDPTPWIWLPLVGGAVVLLVALVVVLVPHEHDVEPVDEDSWLAPLGARLRGLSPVLEQVLVVVAVATCAALLVVCWRWGRSDGAFDQDLPWTLRSTWFVALFVAVTLLHMILLIGGRMPLPIAFSAIGVLALFFIAVAVGRAADVPHLMRWSLLALAVFWLTLTIWHYVTTGIGGSLDAQGWRGAGASVLLAAASWIALLFTSAVVVASANWLNGSTHGVGDLVSTTKVETAAYRSGVPTGTGTWRATGAVVLERARVTVGPRGAVRITAGTLRSDTLTLGPGTPEAGQSVRRKGPTMLRDDVTVHVPASSVRLEYSCLHSSTGRCTAEDSDFKGDAVLTLPQRRDGYAVTAGPGVVLEPTHRPQTPLAVPQVLIWTPLAQLVWLVAVVVAVLVCLLVFALRTGRRIGFWPGTADDLVPERDRQRARSARVSAALAHRAEALLDVIGAVTAPIGLALVVLAMGGRPPWDFERLGWTRGIADAAMYLAVLMSAGLVMLGSQIRRSESTRKAVGILWDLTTFWPRAAHPLAPPCYAERVVPELLTRVRWALTPTAVTGAERTVVLSGHSQGSLISVAVASRLSDEELGRLRLVTYGSQVRALYGRIFPAVFGSAAVGYAETTGPARLRDPFPDMPRTGTPGPPVPAPGSLRARMEAAGGSWTNLFRRTDPLGWRVFSDADSDLDLPVPEVPVHRAGDPGPRVLGHGGYQHSPRYRWLVAGWTQETYVTLPTGTTDVPGLPSP
jgi:hypothetical protein